MADMRQFARQLERFTAAYDRIHAARISERAGHPGSSAAHTRMTSPAQPKELQGRL
jgi:hypothetical protein